MAVHAERAIQSFESGGTPVEMLVVGCPLNVADGFANALRNQGQAAHLKTADDLASLDEQLSGEICDLVVVNADSASVPVTQVVAKVRALSPRASLLLVGTDRKTMKPLALDHALQDFIDIDDPDHVALAIRREHQSHLWQQELARLKRQLSEAEERSNLLVQSSRDAIAYIHEGMHLTANHAYLELFGYETADELDGLPIMDMIDAESRTQFKAALRKINETGRHAEEFRCVTAEGEPFDARMEFSPASIDGELCTQVMIRDQSQSLALQKKIEELTSRDAQTGFFNRQSFMERLEAMISGPQGVETGHSLVQLSITNYSHMRENCGFGCAEQMLTEVAGVLSATVTDAHTIARFGDHDFMILCDDNEPALEVAERCLHNLRSHAFKSIQDSPIKPVYSIGVTRSEKGTEISAHELVNRSCRATGMARAEGENQVVFYNDQVPGETSHLGEADAAVVKLIDNALANDGFRLKYQPIVSLQGDTRENYSVYLRLIDEEGQELEPEGFLSPARDASRLAEVDRWVVRNAIRELANHRRDGKKIIFHIIISRAGIEDDSMLLWICDCLREFRAKGSWLVFQFREGDLRTALQPARELITGLKKINCRIAVSNFNDVESADALLKHMEVDVVKLSPDFMRDLATNNAQQERMTKTNTTLQEAGYKTIASGVEDAGSLAILWNIGVNYIQGYFLQEPSSTISFEGDHEEQV
ncbi:MAG: EAL domain-containing protein [Gammaproteobacteria bacterium]|nr:EAL domain-containing protein [Gammaproteobacteria bacterium]